MEKLIYKFLDEYLGDEVVCVKTKYSKNCDTYTLLSKNNKTVILLFQVRRKDGRIIMFRGLRLTELVAKFFSMENDEVTPIIKNWFGDKHNIVKISDLMKFVK